MPRPINPTIGHCPCVTQYCDEVADVRRYKGHERGDLYLHCPSCHTVKMTGPAFQVYIEAHATWLDAADHAPAGPPATAAPAPAPAPKPPAPAPKPPAPRGWTLDDL